MELGTHKKRIKKILTIVSASLGILIIVVFSILYSYVYHFTENGGIWNIKELHFANQKSLYLKVSYYGGGFGDTHTSIRISTHRKGKVYRGDYVFRGNGISFYYQVNGDTLNLYTSDKIDYEPGNNKTGISVKVHVLSTSESVLFDYYGKGEGMQKVTSRPNNPFTDE
ncbi:MAG TPA: hypothetical protein PLE74_06105 [Candidatus Cloacimonadota bacterium]|nr:hypothetical protein [Candidatus Cloacimonadota bacterium]